MLEYNFNELDNDFITLWSRYMLSYDGAQIGADLEKLAELGQINAIQSYYLFLSMAGITHTNHVIDKKLNENFYSKNYNHLLAVANRIEATDVEDRQLLVKWANEWKKDEENFYQLTEKLKMYDVAYAENKITEAEHLKKIKDLQKSYKF